MRRKRHPLQYEASFVESELADARELVEKIEDHMGIRRDDLKLF